MPADPVVEPAVRGRTVRDSLRFLEAFDPEAAEQVRARMPPASLEAIERVRGLTWLPIEHDRHFPTSVVEVLGEARAEAFFRALVAEQIAGPLLSAIATATMRTLGLSPASLLRAAPMAWPKVYRGFGTLRYQGATARAGSVELSGVPDVVLGIEAYHRSFGGFFAGLIDLCDARGFSTVAVSPAARTIAISLEWKNRAAVSQ